MKILKNLTLSVLIVAIQIGSFGFLVNKHYCNNKLDEVSIFIANEGCASDRSFTDRLFLNRNDCQMPQKEGLSKASCCKFLSDFTKISVYQEYESNWKLFDQLTLFSVADHTIRVIEFDTVDFSTVLRPPPLILEDLLNIYCTFLI